MSEFISPKWTTWDFPLSGFVHAKIIVSSCSNHRFRSIERFIYSSLGAVDGEDSASAELYHPAHLYPDPTTKKCLNISNSRWSACLMQSDPRERDCVHGRGCNKLQLHLHVWTEQTERKSVFCLPPGGAVWCQRDTVWCVNLPLLSYSIWIKSFSNDVTPLCQVAHQLRVMLEY